ncbi:MarR family transcriptional regulator, partial [Streptomyces sp. NPDC056728]
MEYSHSDAELIEQPIGYWAWAAYKAVVTRIRGALAEKGTTQPQWWVLAQVARADRIKTRAEVSETLSGYLDAGEAVLAEEIDATIAHGWITEDAEGRLSLTPAGKDFFDEVALLQRES